MPYWVMYMSVSAETDCHKPEMAFSVGVITQTNTSILKYMLYFVMIDIINDEQLTFVFEFFHCETKEKMDA